MTRILSLVLLLSVAACEAPPPPPAEADATPHPMAADADGVIVHLFEWTWADVAAECEAFLGPNGYAAVQVSPPTENHVVADHPARPWWERYQPVTYALDNRSGDREAFADMVQRCRAAGVGIYVDAVLNHMADADGEHEEHVFTGTGTAGTRFGPYDYPGLYSHDDFHHCGLTDNDDIWDFDDPIQVRTCELVDLSDLATETDKVRDRLAAYVNDLLSLGVAGIRIDAARHMDPADIRAILDRLDQPLYVYQEVIDGAEPKWAADYYAMGDVTEFNYTNTIGDRFHSGRLDDLIGAGATFASLPFMPSSEALVFIDNHDNQRHGGDHIVTYQDGALHDLAMAFMLAYPYGRPRVMSSYAFEDGSQGPPMDEAQNILRVHGADGAVDCGAARWQCEHRHPAVAGMVGFRAAVGTAPLAHAWSDGGDRVAFARQGRGFLALNRSTAVQAETFQTGLPAGEYCDVYAGPPVDGQCVGGSVTVGADGTATVTVAPRSGVALHIEALPGGGV